MGQGDTCDFPRASFFSSSEGNGSHPNVKEIVTQTFSGGRVQNRLLLMVGSSPDDAFFSCISPG